MRDEDDNSTKEHEAEHPVFPDKDGQGGRLLPDFCFSRRHGGFSFPEIPVNQPVAGELEQDNSQADKGQGQMAPAGCNDAQKGAQDDE